MDRLIYSIFWAGLVKKNNVPRTRLPPVAACPRSMSETPMPLAHVLPYRFATVALLAVQDVQNCLHRCQCPTPLSVVSCFYSGCFVAARPISPEPWTVSVVSCYWWIAGKCDPNPNPDPGRIKLSTLVASVVFRNATRPIGREKQANRKTRIVSGGSFAARRPPAAAESRQCAHGNGKRRE